MYPHVHPKEITKEYNAILLLDTVGVLMIMAVKHHSLELKVELSVMQLVSISILLVIKNTCHIPSVFQNSVEINNGLFNNVHG